MWSRQRGNNPSGLTGGTNSPPFGSWAHGKLTPRLWNCQALWPILLGEDGGTGGEAVPGRLLGGGEVVSFAFIFLRYNSPTVWCAKFKSYSSMGFDRERWNFELSLGRTSTMQGQAESACRAPRARRAFSSLRRRFVQGLSMLLGCAQDKAGEESTDVRARTCEGLVYSSVLLSWGPKVSHPQNVPQWAYWLFRRSYLRSGPCQRGHFSSSVTLNAGNKSLMWKGCTSAWR